MSVINLTIPEGHEIDLVLSNLAEGKIKFKKKQGEQPTNYYEIAEKLFKHKTIYYFNEEGTILKDEYPTDTEIYHPVNAVSEAQIDSLLALNRLVNTAKYLNGSTKIIFTNNAFKYSLRYDHHSQKIIIHTIVSTTGSEIYFRTKKLAEQALEILGEEDVLLALTINNT